VKLAVVVQRYGAEINGGAELHARYVAERLARHHEVEVLTTCARDYVSWANELPAGADTVNGLPVRRFPVSHPRRPHDFGRRSEHVFKAVHSLADELAWLDSEGPASPALVRHVARHHRAFDYFIFFSYRYYHAWHGARAVADRAILVPTAERDPAVGLAIFPPVLRGVRALMYNSFEERAMLQAVAHAGTHPPPDQASVVVGIGSEVPARTDPQRFRRAHGLDGPFLVYVGRIDENKGCLELFAYFQRYLRVTGSPLTLVLIGHSLLPVPEHPRIRHLGFVDDATKYDAIAAADALVMPSRFESLSMVALEAWAVGTPVIANGRCDVLRGQCIRSNAGLYYESVEEFAETVRVLEVNAGLRAVLGRNGRDYFARHYAWPVIERKYLDVLSRLQEDAAAGRTPRPMDPLPGWFARRRRELPPAGEVLAGLPAGPVVPSRAVAPHELERQPRSA
jgi:glycosyltransferase involved in cell wall biosynthesis